MKNKYLEILMLKDKFRGVDEGFLFLNGFLDVLHKLKLNNNNSFINVYDYRIDSNFDIFVNVDDFHVFIQNFYMEYLTKTKFQKYNWYNNFCKKIYTIFSRNVEGSDILSDLIIKICTKGFMYFSNLDNSINKKKFEQFLFLEFILLGSDSKDSDYYSKFLVNSFVDAKLLISNQDLISINDRFIFYDFIVSSSNIPKIISHNEFDLKYGCEYALYNLLNVVDFFVLNLTSNDSFKKIVEIFSDDQKHKDCILFLMDYADFDFNKIPVLIEPLDKLFDLLFFKKVLLNEYCFHVIMMSCFKYYIYDNSVKNILMEKFNHHFVNFELK